VSLAHHTPKGAWNNESLLKMRRRAGEVNYVDFVAAVLTAASTVDGRFREFPVAHALKLATLEKGAYRWVDGVNGTDAQEAIHYAILDLVLLGLASEFPTQPASYALTEHGVGASRIGLRPYLMPYVPKVCKGVPRPAEAFLAYIVKSAREAEQQDSRFVLPTAFEAHDVYATMGQPYDEGLAHMVITHLVRSELVGRVDRKTAGDRLIVWPLYMGYLCTDHGQAA
jgi:hypothetical protein